MAPPFWVHCNMCSALLSKDNKHYLLSCTHILCKSCMKFTKGKKCVLCKSDIIFEDLTKLPDKLKVNFEPNIKNLLKQPEKIIEFQQNHATNLNKLTRDYNVKYRQALELYEKEKAEVMKHQKELDDLIKKRRFMQEKLKEVYMRNKLKNQHEVYRNPHNSTMSSGFSSAKIVQSSRRSSTEMFNNRSNFFNDSQTGQGDLNSISTNDFFGSGSALNRKRQKQIDHTQSDRSPFFA